MEQYINKDTLVAEIERYKHKADERLKIKGRTLAEDCKDSALQNLCGNLLHFIDTLEVREVDLDKERMSECPYRKVGCTMYEDKVLECKGACSWVVDYPKLKELKAQKGEEV